MTAPAHERGAALLSVLILVGILGALAVAVFDRLRLATLLARNAAGLEQARAFAGVGETLVATRIDDAIAASPDRTTLAGGWLGATRTLPLPLGSAAVRLTDAGNCFNLNSLVSGNPPDALVARPLAIDQLAALLRGLGSGEAEAHHIAAAAADWIDSDDVPLPDGAEDEVYARAAIPYRTAATPMAEASELRAVAGVTPTLYARLRPWLCALPVTGQSAIDVNTLTTDQAPLLAMLFPGTLPVARAARAIAERPAQGWESVPAFLNTPSLKGLAIPGEAARQLQVQSRWFSLDMTVTIDAAQLRETALVDARRTPARIAARRWTADE